MSDEWVVVLEEDSKVRDVGDRTVEIETKASFKAVPVDVKNLFSVLFRKASRSMGRQEAEQLAEQLQAAYEVLET